MKRNVLSIVLALAIVLSLLPVSVLAAEDGTHTCFDEDGDCWCDECWEVIPHECVDEEMPVDHYCDLCREYLNESCTDVDGNHVCDNSACSTVLSKLCKDENPVDHKCDNEKCLNTLSECEDTEGDDNVCDICGEGIYPRASELNVGAEAGDGEITVTWDELEDVGTDTVASYTVYYCLENDYKNRTKVVYGADNVPFTHTFEQVAAGATYEVGVCATYTAEGYEAEQGILVAFDDLWESGVQVTVDHAAQYHDLVAGEWYYEAVDFVLEKGLMNGIGDGKFDLTGTTSRAMIATILWRLEGCPVVNYLLQFEDVPAESWYTEAVRWAAAEGIVTGYNGKFKPDDAITREQLATMVYRYEQYKGGGFTGMWMFLLDATDRAEVSEWAYEAMCWMSMNDVMTGNGTGALNPKGTASRAEVAQILMNYLEQD